MKRFLLLSLLLMLTILPILQPGAASACVGKSLHIGSNGTLQQDLLAEILAMLISERTGTTVKVERLNSFAATHDALLKAELDIAVEYTGASQLEVLKGPQISDPQQLFDAVKTRYNEELNLVWLQPFGFSEARAVATTIPAQAAPVVRKDTLKKFPALARLINKLGGTIDAATMQRLEAAAGKGTVHDVAKDFLKANHLI
jgi:osmoprotectant transport system substrate-binding protein